MKDYSTYHIPYKERVLSEGDTILNIQKNGFDGKDVVVNSKVNKRVVMYDKYSTTRTLRTIIDNTGSLRFGDVVDTTTDKWLVMTLESRNDIYEKWIAEKCNSP